MNNSFDLLQSSPTYRQQQQLFKQEQQQQFKQKQPKKHRNRATLKPKTVTIRLSDEQYSALLSLQNSYSISKTQVLTKWLDIEIKRQSKQLY